MRLVSSLVSHCYRAALARPVARALTLAAVALTPALALAQPTIPLDPCLWDNGDAPLGINFDGQLSHIGGGVPSGAKAADDFSLCDGEVHKLTSIQVTLATSALPTLDKAKVEIYDDCNGLPGKLLHRLTAFTSEDLAQLPSGSRLVRYTFLVEAQPDIASDLIILRGGTYWLSAYGYADNLSTTLTYFAQSDTAVKGRPAVKAEGLTPLPTGVKDIKAPWTPIDDCCLGCKDLAFKLNGHSCKVIADTGPAARDHLAGGIRSEISESARDSRGAGDFVVNPCTPLRVCYIEGCILSNCDEPLAVAEIYANDCKLPGTQPLHTIKATRLIPLNFSITLGRTELQAFRVVFDLFSPDGEPIELGGPGTAGYWLSIAVRDTYSAEERALFCFSNRCDTTCDIPFNPAASIDRTSATRVWSSLPGREVAFVIAAQEFADPSASPGSNPSSPACRVDADANGRAEVDDLFFFLDLYFRGCP